MAGNPKTKSTQAIKAAQGKAMGRVGGGNANVSKQTVPGSKGVKVGVNKKATLPGNKTQDTVSKMMYGGSTSKKMMYGGTKKKK